MSYFTRLDIANRALQHLGIPRVSSFTADNRPAREANFAIDKLRRAELQRSVWTFATRRVVMRPVVAASSLLVFATYDAAVTYEPGDVVKDSSGFFWLSRRASNLAHTPGSEGINPYWVPYAGPMIAPVFSTTVTYYPGDLVISGGAAYMSVIFANQINHTPPNTTYWRAITGATLSGPLELSPIGWERDPANVRTIYRLPGNFLRMAPQDPKMASGIRQNTTAGMAYNDWEIEEPYLLSRDDTATFIMRFVADQTDVSMMHPLFCEVWAARLAVELADALTQNDTKMATAAGLYQGYMAAAQLISAIEAGTTESEPSTAPPPQQGGGR